VDESSDVQDTDHLTFVHGCNSDFVITEWLLQWIPTYAWNYKRRRYFLWDSLFKNMDFHLTNLSTLWVTASVMSGIKNSLVGQINTCVATFAYTTPRNLVWK
jgi:hypothetical protein